MHKDILAIADTGFIGIEEIHATSIVPKKKSKNHSLTKDDKKRNRKISSERIVVENVLGDLKCFKILAEKYRNRRKRYGLRFNLIAGLRNFELD